MLNGPHLLLVAANQNLVTRGFVRAAITAQTLAHEIAARTGGDPKDIIQRAKEEAATSTASILDMLESWHK